MARRDADAYRSVARSYDAIFGRLNAGLVGLGLKMFPPREGMEVLDVGCGTGAQLAAYQKAGCRVSGIDLSPSMLSIARRRLGDTAHVQLGDATRVPYPDQSFTLILATTVLHEMRADVRAATLAEMSRVLRPEGRILLIDFEAGPVRPLRGWITKGVITLSEMAAGREHHRNYRDFMRRGGLHGLLESGDFSLDQRRVVSGGAIGLYLIAR